MQFAPPHLVRATFVLIAGLLSTSLLGQDISTITLFKAAWYEQWTADDPALYPDADDPYDITAYAYLSEEALSDPDWYWWIQGMTLRTPGNRTEEMTIDYDAGIFDLYAGAVSAGALNLRYTAGTYRFTLSSLISGNSIYNVPLAADDYPPPPKVTNFDAAQTIDPTRDFALRWVPFTGGGTRRIYLEIYDGESFETVYAAGPIDGSATAEVIPAGTLVADRDYLARLAFTRYTYYSSTTVPEAYAGFDAVNMILLSSSSGGSTPDPSRITACRLLENGDLELTAECAPGFPLTVEGAAALDGPWSTLDATTPASSSLVVVLPRAALGNRTFLRLRQD